MGKNIAATFIAKLKAARWMIVRFPNPLVMTTVNCLTFMAVGEPDWVDECNQNMVMMMVMMMMPRMLVAATTQ